MLDFTRNFGLLEAALQQAFQSLDTAVLQAFTSQGKQREETESQG